MIVSPPFLPEPSGAGIAQVDVETVMQGGEHGEGAYPVSLNGWWHGGLHLTSDDAVRAMADGTVHYVRKATSKPDEPSDADPLFYNNGWTSDGVVAIKHETEIGEDASLTWYSVYMHLGEVDKKIKQGDKVWRKQKLGQPGYIDGQPNRMQLDIVMDDADVKTLIGRSPGQALDVSKNGRTDAVWGAAYIHVPAGVKVYSADMRTLQHNAHHAGHQGETAYAAAKQQGAAIGTAFVVGIDYDKGSCTLKSVDLEGNALGRPVSEGGSYEYDLYKHACNLYPENPQSGYQLLRWGRITYRADDSATLTDTAHWRKVALPNGEEGWIDLNASGVTVFSDADFPPWAGWVMAGDDADGNVYCNSAIIKQLVLKDGTQQLPDNQFIARLKSLAVRKKLDRAICKMPSDWDESRLEQIWHAWQHDQDLEVGYLPPSSKEAEQKACGRLQAHFDKLCFWSKAKLPEPSWHLPPKAFIEQMQHCGWLSSDELYQMFPPTAMRNAGHGKWVSESITVFHRTISHYYTDLNKVCRRYGIMTPQRTAAFYANAMVETQWFLLLEEKPNGQRYLPWNGRGFLQLTWPANYIKYWRFTGKIVDDKLARELDAAAKKADHERSDAPLVKVEPVVAAAGMDNWRTFVGGGRHVDISSDTAGAYWTWSNAAKYADQLFPDKIVLKKANGASHYYYTNQAFGEVAATVNVGHPTTRFDKVNGIVARFQAYAACQTILFDVTAFPHTNGNIRSIPEDYRQRRS